jgi:hypothetical protein
MHSLIGMGEESSLKVSEGPRSSVMVIASRTYASLCMSMRAEQEQAVLTI